MKKTGINVVYNVIQLYNPFEPYEMARTGSFTSSASDSMRKIEMVVGDSMHSMVKIHGILQ